MNSNSFFTVELRSKSTPFFITHFSICHSFLDSYIGALWRENQGRNLARKIARASRVAQWHSRTVPIKPPAQVEAISYSVTLKWRQSPTQLLSSRGNPSHTLYEIP